MDPRLILRTEGLVLALLAVATFSILGGPWWLFLVLFLAPDLAMLGYLAGVRTGTMAYNAAHTYLGPAALGAVGLWMGIEIAVLGALIWSAHIGFDRVVGYGLKSIGSAESPSSRSERGERVGWGGARSYKQLLPIYK